VLPRVGAFLILAIPVVWADDPLSGKWLLKHQEVAGKETASNPLTLAITPSGKAFDFAFIVTVNNTPTVSLKFTSSLDGAEAEVAGGDGKKMGTARVSREGASYKVLMEGTGRPAVTTFMTVAPDGKTLTSESDVTTPSGVKVHTEQIFARQ